ncbi:MAG TPA: sigma-70 family RNA polymerase sigma factor [Bacteroidetes bacterium]|nr:sigma-70 family RNA polymerase sigma factor [Bacteroidota bacterium]
MTLPEMTKSIYPSSLLKTQEVNTLLELYQSTGELRYAEAIFQKYYHLVYGMCLKYTEDKALAYDLSMEIFEKLIFILKTAKITAFKHWLFKVIQNECINSFRKKEQTRKAFDQWKKEFEKNIQSYVENEGFLRLINRGLSIEAQLEEAIHQLPETQRVCIELFYFEKKSYKAIAGQTGFSISHVKSYLQHGKKALKKILTDLNTNP